MESTDEIVVISLNGKLPAYELAHTTGLGNNRPSVLLEPTAPTIRRQ